MNTGGYIFFAFSWIFIISMLAYCFYRIFSGKED